MRYLRKRISWVALLTFILSISTLSLYADDPGGLPGSDCDPFETDPSASDYCTPDTDAPLDTWVFLLVFIVLALMIWYWYKQRKSLRTL